MAGDRAAGRRAVLLGLLLAGPAAGGALAEPVALHSPLSAACIASPFGPRAGARHAGLDIPAPAGAWVRAAAAGEVLSIGRIRAGAGLEIALRHADGRITRYAHLGSIAPRLAEGARQVAQGEPIGRVGRSGITRGTHLHVELIVQGVAVDPAPAFGLSPCPRRRDAGREAAHQPAASRPLPASSTKRATVAAPAPGRETCGRAMKRASSRWGVRSSRV